MSSKILAIKENILVPNDYKVTVKLYEWNNNYNNYNSNHEYVEGHFIIIVVESTNGTRKYKSSFNSGNFKYLRLHSTTYIYKKIVEYFETASPMFNNVGDGLTVDIKIPFLSINLSPIKNVLQSLSKNKFYKINKKNYFNNNFKLKIDAAVK